MSDRYDVYQISTGAVVLPDVSHGGVRNVELGGWKGIPASDLVGIEANNRSAFDAYLSDVRRSVIGGLEDECRYSQTVEAKMGKHEATGILETQPQVISVGPSDNPGYDRTMHDLTDPEQLKWWGNWCETEGQIQAMAATHTGEELDSIARKLDADDWYELMRELGDLDDDAGIDRKREILAVTA